MADGVEGFARLCNETKQKTLSWSILEKKKKKHLNTAERNKK